MAETIFVDHQPGTYKVYKTIGGHSIMFLDKEGNSRPVDGGKVYPSRQNAYRRCRQLNLWLALENYLKSDDFKSGIISSTKASWGGSDYRVELFPNGTWSVLWSNQIGNLYESEGVILRLPTLDTDDMREYVDGGAGSEEDFLAEAFENERGGIVQVMRDALSDKRV